MKIKLGELANIMTGNTPSMKVNEYYDSNDIPFIKPDSFKSHFKLEANSFISNKAETKARIVGANCILVSCIGIIGKVGITSQKVAFNQQINSLKVKPHYDIEYIAYNLIFNKDRLQGICNSAVVPLINKSQFSNFEISINKDIIIQRDIKSKLNLLSSIIINNKKRLLLLDDIVKSRFVEIFKNNKAHIAIGELFQVIDGDRGKNYPKATDFFDEGYCLFLNAKNVTKNGFCFDTVQFITQQKDEQLNKGRVLPEDIILTTRGTVGNVAYCDIESSHKHMRINSGMVILRSKDIIYDVDFITYVLSNQINYGKEISGSAQPQLPISKLKDIMIPFPEIFLQKDFGYLIKQINKLKFD